MGYTVFPPSVRTARTLQSTLTTTVSAEGTRTLVVLQGEADLSTRPVLSDVLSRVIAMEAGDVVIDLAQANFVGTATVRVFAAARQLLDRRGRRLIFRSPTRLAARVLDLFGLTELIEVGVAAQLSAVTDGIRLK